MIRAIVGANWGDEGKGKMTDMLAAESDVVVRYQGGANAGHTIINDYGKFALHMLPSGVCHQHTANVIANGVALSVPALIRDLQVLADRDVPDPKVLVSDRAQIVMPYHVMLDHYEEERLGKASFGSTRSGIAPFYSDKYAKVGFQVNELFDEKSLRAKLKQVLLTKNVLLRHLYDKPILEIEPLMDELTGWRFALKPYVSDTFRFLREAVGNGRKILLEGQLGALRDPDFGIYPMVTSVSTLAGYGAVGAGLPPYAIDEIIAVVKAYSSAVGAGPFATELLGADGDELRRRGGDAGEFGATTGRPRRMGWFDAVASRYGVQVQHATSIALVAIDVLSYLDEIPVCTAYQISGRQTRDFPVSIRLKNARPVYSMLPGWKKDIRGCRNEADLPPEARAYIAFIERELGVPIRYISTGPKRDEIICR